jgi:predicted amidohydrolase
MAIAGDVNWPEMTRALALRGAEIILNPMATAMQAGDRDTAVGAVQAVRAFENVCYVVVANAGPLHGAGPMPEARLRSRVLDFEGRALAVAGSDGADTVSATIDLTALRQWRGRPMKNFIAQLQPHLHADDYLEARLWPKGLAAASDVPLDMFAIERDVWRSMVASGRFEGEAGAD